jgi:hypothetical protein
MEDSVLVVKLEVRFPPKPLADGIGKNGWMNESDLYHRLVAILVADAVGYSPDGV